MKLTKNQAQAVLNYFHGLPGQFDPHNNVNVLKNGIIQWGRNFTKFSGSYNDQSTWDLISTDKAGH